eukprot:956292-Prorocentrum_minimum.AAC.1
MSTNASARELRASNSKTRTRHSTSATSVKNGVEFTSPDAHGGVGDYAETVQQDSSRTAAGQRCSRTVAGQ